MNDTLQNAIVTGTNLIRIRKKFLPTGYFIITVIFKLSILHLQQDSELELKPAPGAHQKQTGSATTQVV